LPRLVEPAGATVKVTVTGYKTAGPESQPSAAVQAVVP
jgi:hypothetical protein